MKATVNYLQWLSNDGDETDKGMGNHLLALLGTSKGVAADFVVLFGGTDLGPADVKDGKVCLFFCLGLMLTILEAMEGRMDGVSEGSGIFVETADWASDVATLALLMLVGAELGYLSSTSTSDSESDVESWSVNASHVLPTLDCSTGGTHWLLHNRKAHLVRLMT
jgi:hypothetical protein